MYKEQSVIEGALQELEEDHGGTALTGLLLPARSFWLAPRGHLSNRPTSPGMAPPTVG